MKSTQLKVLKDEWNDCTRCNLASVRTQVIFGSGNSDARLVVVGEAPGKDEDINGVPFVGRAGKLFDKILAAVDIKRDDIWITNTCQCRPKVDANGRENRAPTKKEIDACKPRFAAEMNILKPRVVVLMGNTPLLMATGKRGITKNRGWIINSDRLKVYATLHPASLLHGSTEQINSKKLMVWEDWQEIAREYNEA